ncbi:hypothetical protein K9N68_00655 [Kovacikia minuta CCNUW1]|uniref:hypothetical protein n=1 Tax=Kovacikia minuta TaxID=2931930 RepID=UPI001CC8FAFB|nr:hypothetical protein [Kovacikia minuta]UBF26559.1 hypothetical protein K9N68_00655 [Kovacikia minuta CCNUW1]
MIYFALVWNILIVICWVIGTGLLVRLDAHCFHRSPDRWIIALWSGVVLLAITLLAVSLVLPLSPLVGTVVAITLCGLALTAQQVWAELATLRKKFSLPILAIVVSVELAVAALTSHQVTWIDTGLYHYGSIQ